MNRFKEPWNAKRAYKLNKQNPVLSNGYAGSNRVLVNLNPAFIFICFYFIYIYFTINLGRLQIFEEHILICAFTSSIQFEQEKPRALFSLVACPLLIG